MSPVEEAAAQRELDAALERFRGEPRAALGLGASDDALAARRAFFALCKVYHPAKFARYSPPIVKMCNEVFLAIRRCYELAAGSSPQPIAARAQGTSPSTPIAAGGRTGTPGGMPALKPHQVTPANERATTRMVRQQATPPGGVPIMRRGTPAAGVPITTPRVATPVPTPSRPTPTGPTTPGPSSPPPMPQPPPSATPPRMSTVPMTPETAQFEKGLEQARQQRWADARATFTDLATRYPTDPRYRAYLHYARGWEAFGGGKQVEARAEWQRALACDPSNTLARWALESTGLAK